NKSAAAIFSRWEIRESINHAALRPAISKSCVEATIVEPSGREWIITTVHLHAHALENDERLREAELSEILAALEVHRPKNRPHIVCGDFNANAPYQQIDPDRCKPSTRAEWQSNGGQVPRRVVQALL